MSNKSRLKYIVKCRCGKNIAAFSHPFKLSHLNMPDKKFKIYKVFATRSVKPIDIQECVCGNPTTVIRL